MRMLMLRIVVAAMGLAIASPGFGQAVLSVTKVDTPDPVTAGNLLTYTATATNAGPDSAANLAISDPLPTGTVFISAVASPGATLSTPAVGANGTVTSTWDAAGGTPGGLTPATVSRTLTMVARVCPEAGCIDLENTATVSATDEISAEGESTTTVSVVGDLSITKSGPTEATRGQTITYVLTVQNSGPSNLADAVVTDTLPPGLGATSVISTFPGAVCNILPGNSQVVCTISVGAANQCTRTVPTSGTITIEALVLASAQPAEFENVATVATGTCGTDSDPSDNTATLPITFLISNRAPAMHGAGLAALAALLGAAGALRLRRRTR